MKLNTKQQDVLDKMADGWELAYTIGGRSPGWFSLQEGGQGFGGQSITINGNTVGSLERRELIKRIYGFPTSKYILIVNPNTK